MFLLVIATGSSLHCSMDDFSKVNAPGCLNITGGCHFFNLRHVCGDSFHALRSPGVSGVEMRDRCKLSFPQPLARAFSLAQTGELARRLPSLLNKIRFNNYNDSKAGSMYHVFVLFVCSFLPGQKRSVELCKRENIACLRD